MDKAIGSTFLSSLAATYDPPPSKSSSWLTRRSSSLKAETMTCPPFGVGRISTLPSVGGCTVGWPWIEAARGNFTYSVRSGGGGGCIEIYGAIWDAYWGYPGWLHTL